MESLGKRLESLRERHGLNKVEFGKVAGVSGVTVGKWEKDLIIPRDNKLKSIADHFGTTFEELKVGQFSPEDNALIRVPVLDRYGEGCDYRWLDKRSIPDGASCSLAFLIMEGDSMGDLLPDSSLVLIDRRDTQIKDGRLYALKNDMFVFFRKVSFTSSGIRHQSFNNTHTDELLSFQEMNKVKVLGRVVASLRGH